MSVDYFVAELECSNCKKISPADSSTNIGTHLYLNGSGRMFRAGDQIQAGADELAASGYLAIARPTEGAAIRVLERWECPSCDSSANWAELVLRDGRIEKIAAAKLDRATFERAHFITDQAVMFAADLAGQDFKKFIDSGMDPIAVLKKRL